MNCQVCDGPMDDSVWRRLCNRCREIQRLLPIYLNEGGERARRFVQEALDSAGEK